MEKYTLEIEAKLDKATKGVENLTSEIESLKKAQSEQLDQLQKNVKDLDAQNKKTAKSVKGIASGFKGVGLAIKSAGIGIVISLFSKLTDAMMSNKQIADTVETVFSAIGMVFKEVSDRLISVYDSVSEATGGFDALKKVLGGAFSISINSIVLAIQGIVLGVQKAQLAWEDSFLGGKDPEKIKELQSNIDETTKKIEGTVDRIKTAGQDIADNFVEAVTEVGTLATAVAEETANAIEEINLTEIASNAKKLTESKKNYALLEAQSRRLVEKYDLEAEKQRQIRDDVSISISERIKANEELSEVLKTQSEEEKKGIQARIDALNNQIALEGESYELTAQLYDLNTEMLAIDAKVAGFKSEQLTNEVALKQELLDLDKTSLETKNQLAISEANFLAESETNEYARVIAKQQAFELEKEIELKRLADNILLYKEGTQARIDAESEYALKKQEFTQKELENEKTLADTKRAYINQGLDAVISVAGQESKVGKALFIAKQALALKELIMNAKNTLFKAKMNAAESGTDLAKGSAKAASSAPPPLNLIPIALFAAQAVGIIASIKSAVSKSKDAVSSAGVSVGGGGGTVSAPTTPAVSIPPAFNVVGASGTSQLAEAIGDQEQQPIQAYVVANDVTTAQSMDRNIVEGASIG